MVIDEPHCVGAGDHLMRGGWDPSSSDFHLNYALAKLKADAN
jgi:hypothetical protein